MEHRGEFIGVTIGSLSPAKLVFVTRERINLGEYVALTDEIDGRKVMVLARVNDLVFSDYTTLAPTAKTLGTPERALRPFVDRLIPSREDELYLVAQTDVLGIVGDDGTLVQLRTPVKPGLRVEIADRNLLELVLSSRLQNPISLGNLSTHHEVQVSCAAEKLVGANLIVGATGTGKTQLAMKIASELNKNGFPNVVVDPLAEWEMLGKKSGVDYLSGSKLKIDWRYLTPDEIGHLIDASGLELEELQKHSSGTSFSSFKDIVSAMRDSEIPDFMRLRLERRLANLETLGIFASPGIRFDQLFSTDRLSILGFEGWNEQAQEIAIRLLLRDLMNRKSQDGPVFLIIDSADMLLRDSRAEVRELLSWSRKVKAGVFLVIQRPSEIPNAIRGLTRNLFAFMLIDDANVKAVEEQIGMSMADTLRRLKPLEFLASGSAVSFPVLLNTEPVV